MKHVEIDLTKLEVVSDFRLEAEPMMGAVIVTFRSQLADRESGTNSPMRELIPIALTGPMARHLQKVLGEAAGFLEGIGTSQTGKPGTGHLKQ